VIIAIVFVIMSCERLVRGPKPTNCDSPAVRSRNDHYDTGAARFAAVVTHRRGPVEEKP
jgi:hypothetical protein